MALKEAAAKAASSDTPVKAAEPTLVDLLSDPAQQTELDRALPPGLSAERFTRIALTAVKTNPDLLAVGQTPAGRQSFMHAIHRCAQMGLEPNSDLGHAYLLPFKDRKSGVMKLQFILGYKGILEMAHRGGTLRRLDVNAVYKNDEFKCTYGTNGVLEHEPALSDRGEIVCYYGYAEFSDGGYYYVMLTLDDIDARKKRSASVAGGRRSPWDTDPVAMSRKTVIRAMAPYLRMSTEAQDMVALDEAEVSADGTAEFIDVGIVEHTPVDESEPPAEPDASNVADGDTVEATGQEVKK